MGSVLQIQPPQIKKYKMELPSATASSACRGFPLSHVHRFRRNIPIETRKRLVKRILHGIMYGHFQKLRKGAYGVPSASAFTF